jgi:pteridine reductase
VAIVTGAMRRVGRAIALELERAGCSVLGTSRTSPDPLLRLDLDNLEGAERWAAGLARALPRLDVLVHNASIYGPTPLDTLGAGDLLRYYRVHAAAPLLITGRLAPLLRGSALPAGGAVVAMADMHVLGRPRRDFSAYAMSKAALVEMVRTLARDLAPRVRVNAVAPGVVAWPESGSESDAPAQEAYVRRVPLARAGTPQDAAGVVRWLALEAGYVTGEIVRLDGGRWLA